MLSEDDKLIEAQKSVIKNISDDELLNILKDGAEKEVITNK